MKKFLKRTLIFFTPLFLYLTVVVIVDPYNYFSNSVNIISSKTKKETAYKLNYPLFKLLEFDKNPIKNVVLGDSRTNNLDMDFINSCSEKKFVNLAYGGGTLKEILNTFWEVTETTKLETVIIGLNFNLYNKTNNMDRVSEAIILKENFLSYATSKYTFKSIGAILKNMFSKKSKDIEVPDMTKEEFWRYQLNSSANNTYRIYKYPENYFEQLNKMATYCRMNNIELIFFIPPTHVSLQNKISEFKLRKEEKNFKLDLQKIAPIYDFDYPNEITEDKEKFKDPYHCKKPISRMVAKVIFCNNDISEESKYFIYHKE